MSDTPYRQQAKALLMDMIDRGTLIVRDMEEWNKLALMGEIALMRGRSDAMGETAEALRQATDALT